MKKGLNTYIVYRPYCSPGEVVVMAKDKKQAFDLVARKYGPATGFGKPVNSLVELINKKGVVI